MSRPEWDTWFMSLAFVASQRSLDKHTKHGCVIVSSDRSVLSMGYNGPPRGCLDEEIPLERPDKYLFMKHAETNAIVNAAACGVSLKGASVYVTGIPCHSCYGDLTNLQVKEVIFGPVQHQRTKVEAGAVRIIGHSKCAPPLIKFDKMDDVMELLGRTSLYINSKRADDEKKDPTANH